MDVVPHREQPRACARILAFTVYFPTGAGAAYRVHWGCPWDCTGGTRVAFGQRGDSCADRDGMERMSQMTSPDVITRKDWMRRWAASEIRLAGLETHH
jgi:hypothetical protein